MNRLIEQHREAIKRLVALCGAQMAFFVMQGLSELSSECQEGTPLETRTYCKFTHPTTRPPASRDKCVDSAWSKMPAGRCS